MVVEVVPEIEQVIFEIYSRPEQRVIQTLASNGADTHSHPLIWKGKREMQLNEHPRAGCTHDSNLLEVPPRVDLRPGRMDRPCELRILPAVLLQL